MLHNPFFAQILLSKQLQRLVGYHVSITYNVVTLLIYGLCFYAVSVSQPRIIYPTICRVGMQRYAVCSLLIFENYILVQSSAAGHTLHNSLGIFICGVCLQLSFCMRQQTDRQYMQEQLHAIDQKMFEIAQQKSSEHEHESCAFRVKYSLIGGLAFLAIIACDMTIFYE